MWTTGRCVPGPLGLLALLGGEQLQESHKGAPRSAGPRVGLMALSQGNSGFAWVLTVEVCVAGNHMLQQERVKRK